MKAKRTAAPATCVAIVHPEFLEDLRWWVAQDRRTALKIFELMDAILSEPCSGIGKPEPLKYLLQGTWSRRITEEHRLVYRPDGQSIHFLQCRFHYG